LLGSAQALRSKHHGECLLGHYLGDVRCGMCVKLALLAFPRSPDRLYPLHNRRSSAGPQDARAASIVIHRMNDDLFQLEIMFVGSARSWPRPHAAYNPRGGGLRRHNPPSSSSPGPTSSSGKMTVSCRLRSHHVFEGSRVNPPRPRSMPWARTCTRSSPRRSTFLANPFHKLDSPRRRAPEADKREGFGR